MKSLPRAARRNRLIQRAASERSRKSLEKVMVQRCEACERANVEVIDQADDPQHPYRLCGACHVRLHSFALRPLEWYNLAKRYGWHQFLLHDDFYDDDGTAIQPDGEVETPEAFPAPRLEDVKDRPELLLDYSITRWHFEPNIAVVWRAIPPQTALSILCARFDTTWDLGIRALILTVCAAVLGNHAEGFVRRAWNDYPERAPLASLSEASAACLPASEGFERVKSAVNQLEHREKRNLMFCLGYFHSQEALKWIEENIFEPITESWGYLAAASNIDWPRIERWFEYGRPFSLVAIDAMAAIVRPMSPFIREYGPSLRAPPTLSSFKEILLGYRERDPVPRVQRRIDGLLGNADLLTKSG
jgi:hypothetical protein